MNNLRIAGSAAALVVAAFFAGQAQAAMVPAAPQASASFQRVDCAVGFHIGPAGACIIGTEEHHDTVIENRAADPGCETKTVKRTNDMGDSETRTATHCD